VSDNNHSTMSFDRMRSMLMRAAEIRDSEQQQIFDALDEIHARLSPLESLGSVRKRLSEMPDRAEFGGVAERVDTTLARLDALDGAIAGLSRSVDAIVDRLAKPFAQLDGRLDGVAGRFEGVAGRMDGLEDRIAGLHKRIDDLDHHLDKQDSRLDGLPSAVHAPVRERIEGAELALRSRLDEVDEGVHEHLDGTREAVQRTVGEATESVHKLVGETRDGLHGKLAEIDTSVDKLVGDTRDGLHGRLDELASRPAVDPTDKLDALADRLERLAGRLDEVAGRLDTVEGNFDTRLGSLAGAVEQRLDSIDGTLSNRPDVDSLVSLVRRANEESEQRHAGQLDEAMATFAELILGGGPAAAPPPPPRPAQRRPRKNTKATRDADAADTNGDDS
jgi:ABC-type transporter Mla subunit MlaD